MTTRVGHAVRDNGAWYWLRLIFNTARFYIRHRRWAALARALWLTIGRGYYCEICQECGRKVGLVWHADDRLYRDAVHDGVGSGPGASGVLCIDCFEGRVDVLDRGFLIWTPTLQERSS